MIVTIGFPLRETSKPVWSILPCDVRPRILGGSHEATLRLSTAPEEVGAAACSGIAGRDDFKGRFWDGFSMISTYLNHEHQVKFCPWTLGFCSICGGKQCWKKVLHEFYAAEDLVYIFSWSMAGPWPAFWWHLHPFFTTIPNLRTWDPIRPSGTLWPSWMLLPGSRFKQITAGSLKLGYSDCLWLRFIDSMIVHFESCH